MTNEEKQLIELDSIQLSYKIVHKEFLDKIKKGYTIEGRFSALECFATDLDNFYWTTNECIKRAELVRATYNRKDLLDRLEAYTTEFLEFYKDEKKKVNTEEKLKKFKEIEKKIKGYDYIKIILN